MRILSTSISIDKKQAQKVVLKNRRGLVDRVALFFQKSSPGQESILSSGLIYYPHWLVGTEVKFSRPVSNPRIKYAFLGIDGCFGSVSQAVGYPEAKEIFVDGSRVVCCKITKEEAGNICIRYLENTYGFKYKKVPEVKLMEIQQVFKPNIVFSCKKGAKEYFRAVDAETGGRNYVLDIKYKELSFLTDSVRPV
jgi:hypothetical protein